MKKYGVSKNFRLTLTAAIIGCILFFPALISLIRFRLAGEFNLSCTDHLHAGDYYHCQIEQYYVLPLTINGEKTSLFAGRLGSLSMNGNKDQFVVFYANLEGQKYVRIGIQDAALLSRLDAYKKGQGEPIQFFGKVIRRRAGYASLESMRKWDNFDVDKYLKNYCIIQLDEKTEYAKIMRNLLWGTLFFILSAVFIALGYGIYPILTRPIEETAEYVRLAKVDHYALSDELEQKKRKLEILQDRLQSLRKWFLLGIFITLFGIAILIYVKILWLFPNSLSILGWIAILAGAELLWHAFINSDIHSALRIADKFTLETVAVMVKREEILIGVLSHRIDEEKHALALRAKEDAARRTPKKSNP